MCAGEVRPEDLTEEARKVLSAAARTGERFGAHHLADILVGASTDKVLERGHQALPTFGAGRDRDRDWWLSLIREMDTAELLVRGEGRTAGYSLSHGGRLVLSGKQGFAGSRSLGTGGRAGARRAEESPAAEPLDGEAQEKLFQQLRAARMKIAKAKTLPPYVIFSDKSLRSMAQNLPTTGEALLRCHGVGEAKLEAYGSTFLAVIREWSTNGE